MEKKLTLKLDKKTIDQAKIYARRNNLSLSKMVEKYFKSLSEENTPKQKNTKLVNELSGIISLNKEIDHKDEKLSYLLEKYK